MLLKKACTPMTDAELQAWKSNPLIALGQNSPEVLAALADDERLSPAGSTT